MYLSVPLKKMCVGGVGVCVGGRGGGGGVCVCVFHDQKKSWPVCLIMVYRISFHQYSRN